MPRRRCRLEVAAVFFGLVLASACGDPAAVNSGTSVDGVTATAGLVVELLADGLDGPTQLVVLRNGDLIVSEIGGAEDGGLGRVLRLAGRDLALRTPLLEGLSKPTGIAVVDDQLWVMEQRRLSVGPLEHTSDRTVVLDDLPFNGRSEGTLTVDANLGVLYDTSGSRRADRPAELVTGSGTLWSIASPTAEPAIVASGFKHAYAHVIDADGQLWSTEMSDGRLDGAVPPDELVRVTTGDDFGYPLCVGDRDPVAELGATNETCAATPRSHALFPPGATPTSVAVAPWDPDVLVVALWNRGEVVAVPRSEAGRPHVPEVLLSGVGAPQHLVADHDRLLLTDFAGGRILSITKP
jgi:glucose/arabinose dehydrogenase